MPRLGDYLIDVCDQTVVVRIDCKEYRGSLKPVEHNGVVLSEDTMLSTLSRMQDSESLSTSYEGFIITLCPEEEQVRIFLVMQNVFSDLQVNSVITIHALPENDSDMLSRLCRQQQIIIRLLSSIDQTLKATRNPFSIRSSELKC